MELNQQLSAVQDDLKLLKGEIKSILKELRGAILAEDNPFTKGAGTPTFRAVGRAEKADAEEPDEPEEEVEPDSEDSTEADDSTVTGGPPTPPAGALGGGPSTPPPGALAGGPSTPPAGMPGGPTTPPAGIPGGISNEPTPLHGPQLDASSEDAPDAPAKPEWNMLTIASLAAWSEDALKSLGPRRFQTVLELACFAELFASDVKDILSKMAEISPEDAVDEKPMHINDCLVVLHQLEAILQGDKVRRLPMRRRRRSRIR